jgi:3-dehydroquinate dehydratase/shikimate dehydrogenase
LRRRRDAVIDADLVELRLDSVSDPDVPAALEGRRLPAVVTCRPVWEGGEFRGSEEDRRRLLRQALSCGAEYVDLEWRAMFTDLIEVRNGRGIVLSAHDFDGVPDALGDRLRTMRATGAEVVKVAVRANRLSDCARLLTVARTAGADGGLVVIGMGDRGLPSRVLAEQFGSAWTYAGPIAEVGQMSVAELVDAYRFRGLSRSTSVYGIVGSPVSHSVSPAMHNAAFREAGIDAVYLPLAAADVADFVTFARAFDLKGASVTIPFKVALRSEVDDVQPIARRIGAINTIRSVDGRWIGGNTDAAGFLQPLDDRRVNLRGKRAAILGSGGSARAVAIALASRGADVRVHARRLSSAEPVAELAGGRVAQWPPQPGTWDVLVNCTPVGMRPRVEETPVPAAALTGSVVYDLVYNPRETRLLRDAHAAGCRTIGGLDMLVAQAEEQFEWWTGKRPAPGVMRASAVTQLGRFEGHDDVDVV